MLTIVVTWRDRLELSQSIPFFLEIFNQIEGELIIVNFDGDDQLLTQAIQDYKNSLKVVKVHQQQYFHKTIAANIGAGYAKGDVFFFCDCDIILDSKDLVKLYQEVKESTKKFGNLIGVTETKINSIGNDHVTNFGYELRIKTADGRVLKIVDQEEDSETGYRNAPGLLMVKKTDFLTAGGYNGNLHGWGWEDQDMISRLTLGVGLERTFYGKAMHISHDDHARTGNYPLKDRWASRDNMFRQALSNYNNNKFVGTYQEDIQNTIHNLVEV